MRCVRVVLAKRGRAKYLSHLDMQRCMMRAVRRAGIDLWYTEGFNPHPYIAFALPLPLGVESDCEPMDMRVEDTMTDEEIRASLSATMPEGIEIVSVGEGLTKPGDIAFAEYSITLYGIPGVAEKLSSAVKSGNLPAEKTGKKGRYKVVKQINVAELLGNCTVEDSGDTVQINAILAAGSQKNLSPFLFIEALGNAVGENLVYKSVVRRALLLDNYRKF